MYVEYIEGTHFRGIPDFFLKLHERLNVFIGTNGVGKSSMLYFIALMLSQCSNLTTDSVLCKISDINNDFDKMCGKIRCRHDNSYILAKYSYSENELCSKYFENFSGKFSDTEEKNRSFSRMQKELKEEELPFTKNFPLVVSYPANRAILEIPERIRGFRPAIHPFDALENALESITDFRSFIALFRMNENSSRKNLQNDHYARWQAKQVQAVNDAICKVIPEFGELHVTQKPFRISVLKKEKKLDFLQLSDGGKCLIALLGDLAQRLAICNPALENPLEGDGIVLVDELELHLHPAWQSILIDRLLTTFPNCQFLVTTHSHLVLGNVKADNIWIMQEECAPCHPDRSYGMEASELLREIMGTQSRPPSVTAKLEQIDRLIDAGQFDKARAALQELAHDTGKIPAIYAANSYLAMMGEEQADIEGGKLAVHSSKSGKSIVGIREDSRSVCAHSQVEGLAHSQE
ncbi:MAG TPA: AAA family ATPase [Candidatus Desulfovibrio intestinipullorum]|uniref:AAA family ATPase n=1 Tax=Candidatus Desulfovibrio intestinipullorum TaxID=2838536 RepID=A0A9D1PW61_9BACT|nr:AAA family ATPase [Candidatus Desulfovibrio intestinipullorum]